MGRISLLDLTLPTPAANLALDEALLEACDGGGPECLRFWEPDRPFVVVGYANHVAREVDVEACAAAGVPILRRVSGGGTVVQLPGCLNYAVVLRFEHAPECATIGGANRFVLERVGRAIEMAAATPLRVALCGDTDLVIGERKFAGNAQRRLRHALLVHGSILLSAELDWMERLLRMPSRSPAYRAGREHAEFVLNLGLERADVVAALRRVWGAEPMAVDWPRTAVERLVREKYGQPDWNRQR